MQKKLSFILISSMMLLSLGVYFLVVNGENYVYAQELKNSHEEVVILEIADAISEFAYVDQPEEYFTFLEEEMERQELEKRKIEEAIVLAEKQKAKEEADKLAKIEADKKAKEEAEIAKVEAEKLAKLEAEKKEKEEKEKRLRLEEERKVKVAAEREAKYKEAQAIKEKIKAKSTVATKPAVSTVKPKTTNTPTNAPSSDVEALAKIIHAEAKGEPYQGKLAVGAVILNRVADSRFPNSITGVIFAPKQFQPVTNGAYQNARPTNDDYRAAKEALNGSDPTGGATFFYAPSSATTKWHETLTHTTTIGGHKFFKN